MPFMNLIEQLKMHEGFRGSFYLCTANKKTIGYGHNVDENPLPVYLERDFDFSPMTMDEGEELLINDVKLVVDRLLRHFNYLHLSSARQAVLINMAFNMGVSGLLLFKNMFKAIANSDFERASVEMMNSKWAIQVGCRSDELAQQMLTGEW
jgi:lysozyme